MTTHLISCGPSVFDTWHGSPGPGEPVVGINSIIDYFPVDWLCMRDPFELRSLPRIGIARGRAVPRLEGLEDEWLGNWRRCRLTFPLALRWALLKWPDRKVKVYGCDMSGEQGACRDGDRHDPGRWQAERKYSDIIPSLFPGRVEYVRS